MKLKYLVFFLFIYFQSFSQNIQLSISYNTFFAEDNYTYLEVYYLVEPHSLNLKDTKEGLAGAVDITLMFSQGEEVMNYDKLRIPVLVKDSLDFAPFLQQSRLKLDTGNYILTLEVSDINIPDSSLTHRQNINISFDFENTSFSKALILDSYKKSSQNTAFSKAGYELYPLISYGVPFIQSSYMELPFYSELYNVNKSIEEGEDFLLQYYIKDEGNGDIISKFYGFKKKKSQTVIPFLASFDISELYTGNYSLIIKAIDKENNTIAKDSLFFYRVNNDNRIVDYDHLDSLNLENSFVSSISSFDSIYKYLDCIYPISSLVERDYAHQRKKSGNLESAKQFFFNFWYKKNPTNPGGEWDSYYTTVKQIDHKYRTPVMPGYKTSRGRVFLQYGPPYLVETELSDSRSYPYEIWQYDRLASASSIEQISKVFIFVRKVLASNDFELVHSDATGEIYNPRWKLELHGRDYQPGSIDETNPDWSRGSSGSSYDNNIIMGGSNSK